MKHIIYSIILFFFAFTLMSCIEPIEPVTVQFDTQGGNNINDAVIEFRQEYDFPIPVRDGYSFIGWFFSIDDQTPYILDVASIETQTITLYAKWTAKTFNVTYALDGSENNVDNVLTYTIEDDLVNLLAPSKVGYTFLGWYEDSDFTGNAISAINPNRLEDISLFAKFEISQYTLTFDTRGGESIAPLEQDFGTAVSTPNQPTRDGHTFAGWFEDVAATTPYTFTTMPIGNITVYANWTRNTYNITLDSNGGSALSQTTFTFGFGDELDLPKPTLLGYNFVGWQATGTEVIYNNGNIMPSRNLELAAQWEEKEYPVVYYLFEKDVTNPNVLPQTRGYKLGEKVESVAIPNPGYTFDGWFDSKTGNPFPFGFNMPDATEPYVIFGKWTAIVYTVTYNLNNGVNNPENPVEFTVEDSIPLKAPDRTGFEFQGWDSESVTVSNVGGTVTDLVLTARWTLKEFDITYDLGGEGANNNFDNLRTYNIETAFTFLNPTRPGAVFKGWINTATNQPITVINVGTTGALSLIATWEITVHQLSLTSLPGGTPVVTTVEEVTAISLPTPTRTGYTFVSWTEANQTIWTNGQLMPNRNLTLTANWTLNTYSITYDGNGIAQLPEGLPTTYNYELDISITKPVRLGWTFLGWDFDGDDDHDFTDGFDKGIYAENLALKAIWTPIVYTLTYDSNNGSAVESKFYILDQLTTGLFLDESTRPGYTFIGWFENDYNWSTNPQARKMPNNNITVRAEWELNTYSITYNGNGALSLPEGLPTTYNYTLDITITKPVRLGWTFLGWDFDGDDDHDFTDGFDKGIYAENLALKAIWTPIVYTLTYDSNNGSAVESKSYILDQLTTGLFLDESTRPGYTFIGWFENDYNWSTNPENKTMPNNHINVRAEWELNTYSITYVLDGGLLDNTLTEYTTESETIILTNPLKENFVFAGYFDNSLFSGDPITEITRGSTSSKTLYAKFERINLWYFEIDEQTSTSISVSLYIGGYVDFAGFDITITYNKDAITYKNLTNPLGATVNDKNSGSIKMNFFVTNPITNKTLISKFTFDVKSNEAFDIALNIKDMLTLTKNYDIIDVSYDVITFKEEKVNTLDFGTTAKTGYIAGTFTFKNSIDSVDYTLNKDRAQINISSSAPHTTKGGFLVLAPISTSKESFVEINLDTFRNISSISFNISTWSATSLNNINLLTNKGILGLQYYDTITQTWEFVKTFDEEDNIITKLSSSNYVNVKFNATKSGKYRIYYTSPDASVTTNTAYAITIDDFKLTYEEIIKAVKIPTPVNGLNHTVETNHVGIGPYAEAEGYNGQLRFVWFEKGTETIKGSDLITAPANVGYTYIYTTFLATLPAGVYTVKFQAVGDQVLGLDSDFSIHTFEVTKAAPIPQFIGYNVLTSAGTRVAYSGTTSYWWEKNVQLILDSFDGTKTTATFDFKGVANQEYVLKIEGGGFDRELTITATGSLQTVALDISGLNETQRNGLRLAVVFAKTLNGAGTFEVFTVKEATTTKSWVGYGMTLAKFDVFAFPQAPTQWWNNNVQLTLLSFDNKNTLATFNFTGTADVEYLFKIQSSQELFVEKAVVATGALQEVELDVSNLTPEQRSALNLIIIFDKNSTSGSELTLLSIVYSLPPVDTTGPVITGATDKSILIDSTFNPLTGVSAVDVTDGDVTEDLSVVIKNSLDVVVQAVDTSAAGVFTVTYTVEDSLGNISNKTITVTVIAKVTLKFTDIAGNTISSYIFDSNQVVTNVNYPDEPVVSGYTFKSWSLEIPTQMGIANITIQAIYEQIQMTLSELSQFDGKNGNKAYIAVDGKIYDVTGNSFWPNGNHNGYQAGQDLTVQLSSSPHGIANVLRQPLVGFLVP